MSSYFPLPPNINTSSLPEKILGSITFLNFPNNLEKKNLSKVYRNDIYIGIYLLDDKFWKLIKVVQCLYKDFVDIDRYQLSLSDHEMAVAIMRKSNDFPGICEFLPSPDTLKVDKANVAERVSYNFSYDSSQASFQGEYPVKMSTIEKGTFFSSDSLKDTFSCGKVNNFLLLMNLNISSKRQSNRKVRFYDPIQNLVFLEIEARQNLISILDLNSLIDSKFLGKIFFISSNDCLFIPLTLSIDKYSKQISVEHTHPPDEMFWGKNKWDAIKILKKKWVL